MISILQLDLGGVLEIEVRFALAFGLVCNELAFSIGSDVCKEGSGAFDVVFSDAERYLVDEGVGHVRADDDVVGVIEDW